MTALVPMCMKNEGDLPCAAYAILCDKVQASVSVELLNLERATGDRIRDSNDRMREALKAAREFIDGMSKPTQNGGVFQISSYHPCRALVDKIDAALR